MLDTPYVDAATGHLAALFPAAESDAQDEPTPREPPPIHLAIDLAPDVEAELAAKNAARHDWIAELGRPDRAQTHGSYRRQSDVWVDTTDLDATLMHKKGGGTASGITRTMLWMAAKPVASSTC